MGTFEPQKLSDNNENNASNDTNGNNERHGLYPVSVSSGINDTNDISALNDGMSIDNS